MTEQIFLVSEELASAVSYDVPDLIQDRVKGAIKLISYSYGMKQQVTTDVSSSSRTSGSPVMTDISCEKQVDETSGLMSELCLRAKPLGLTCTLLICRLDGDKLISMVEYKLACAIISIYEVSSVHDALSIETFGLNFVEFTRTNYIINAEGQLSAGVTTGWSVAKNRPIREISVY